MAAAATQRELRAGIGHWRKPAFALLILTYFLYFNWNGLWARFAADDMMNMVGCWRPAPARLLLDALLPWHGAFRPMAGLFYLPLHHFFGLNPLPYHAGMLAILLGNLYVVYRFALRIGCGELQAGLATLILAYHAGLSMLYYNTSFIYDVLCFAFYMGAFLCYARVRAQGRLLRGSDTALVMGLYLCALDSKEMALTLPIMLLAYEWIYGDGWPAAWTRKGIAAWLHGPGRVVLYCVVLNLLYLDGKVFGSDALTQNAAYRPDLSLHRVFEFEKTAMGDLFLSWDTFNSLGVVAGGPVSIGYSMKRRGERILVRADSGALAGSPSNALNSVIIQIKSQRGVAMGLKIGDVAPDFEVQTTEGHIRFHDWIGDSWAVLFSHPKDFTPVCTTELGYMAKLKPEFDKRNVKIIGLSVDPIDNHTRWADDIKQTQGYAPNYPMIGEHLKFMVY